MNSDPNKLAEDGLKILESALAAAPGASVVTLAVTDAAALKDVIAQLLLAIPPIDAPALDPTDRAEVDAAIEAEKAKG